jgi:hypothetical protein
MKKYKDQVLESQRNLEKRVIKNNYITLIENELCQVENKLDEDEINDKNLEILHKVYVTLRSIK